MERWSGRGILCRGATRLSTHAKKKKGGAPREAWRGELRIVDMSGRADDSSSSTFGRPYSPRFLLPRHHLIWSREAEPDPLFVGDEPNRRSFLLS